MRGRLAAAVDEAVAIGVDRDGPARMNRRVVVHEEDLAILAEVGRIVVVEDAQPDRERELVRGHVRLPLDDDARGRRGEVGAGRERVHHVGETQVGEKRPGASGRCRGRVEADAARARPASELPEARRLDADPELECPGEGAGRVPVGGGGALDRHLRRPGDRIEDLEPRRALERRLRRDLGRNVELRHAEPLERGAQVDPAVAEVLVPAHLRRIGVSGAGGVAGEDIVGGERQYLLHLVGGERARQQVALHQLLRVRHEEASRARGLAGAFGAGHALHVDVRMAAVLREVRVAEPGADRPGEGDSGERGPVGIDVAANTLEIGDGALHEDRVVEVRRRVVVRGVQVGGHVHLRDAVLVGILRRCLGELGGCDRADRGLGHLDAIVGSIEEAQREVVIVGDEGVPDADRDEPALGAETNPREAVVAFGEGVRGAAAAMVVR